MTKILKDLALALLNATLILVALCLFLAWQLAATVDGIAMNFAKNLEIVGPLKDEMRDTRTEIQRLRSDLATLRNQGGAAEVATMQRILDQIEALNIGLNGMQANTRMLAEILDQLIDHSIETAADNMIRSVAAIRGCIPLA